MKQFHLLLMTLFGLFVSCATQPAHLSGKTDIPMLVPDAKYTSWTTEDASFDQSRYYLISKYNPAGKFITILASDGEEPVASPHAKQVMIPEIGLVRYRRCSTGGDGELPRYETDPFIRDDGHGGKVFYIVRVNTSDGDQEAMMRAVRWEAPGAFGKDER